MGSFFVVYHSMDLYLLSSGHFPSFSYYLAKTDLMTDDRHTKNFK